MEFWQKKKTAKKAASKPAKKAKAPKQAAAHDIQPEGQDAMEHAESLEEAGLDHESETGVAKDEFGKEESEFENLDDDDDFGTPAADEEESSDDEGYF